MTTSRKRKRKPDIDTNPPPRQSDAMRRREPLAAARLLASTRTPEWKDDLARKKALIEQLGSKLLTKREHLVIELRTDGATRFEIARELHISVADVVEIQNDAIEKLRIGLPEEIAALERRTFAARLKNPKRIIT